MPEYMYLRWATVLGLREHVPKVLRSVGNRMDISLIPKQLHHLVPLVEKYGIEDDGYRDDLISHSSTEDLTKMAEQFSEQDAEILNSWLTDSALLKSPNMEYLMFSAFFMAYEYAMALLQSRKK